MDVRTRLEPAQVLQWLVGTLRGRISIPLSVVSERLPRPSEKLALEVEPASPGLRIRGKAYALGAPIVFAVRVDADGVHVEGQRRTVRLRLSEVELSTPSDAPGPLARAIRDGSIDTDNPATLLGNLVSLPDMVVEAKGQELVIDLMRIPALRRDEMLSAALAAATSYLCIRDVRITGDAIELRLGVLPGGAKEAAMSTARAAFTPVVRLLWPEGRGS
jgi:hypothetical protein